MVSDILKLAEKQYPAAVKLRRQLHQYPELGFQEQKTASILRDKLRPLGLKISESIAGTGFTALLEGTGSGKVAAYRADMDALPITEQSDIPYKSRNAGKMHACGHDVHMSIAVGIASILSRIRSEIRGAVKFIFQPSEEMPPGGASRMIEEGVLRSPTVDMIFGLHVHPDVKYGKVGICDGVMMARVLDFNVEVQGRGGHAACPDECVDAVVVAANIVTQLQNVVSRGVDPLEPAVLTFGKIVGGTARNAIADKVSLEGTMRSLSKKSMSDMKKLVERTCRHVSGASGATCKFEYFTGYPQLENDIRANSFVRNAAVEMFGKKSVVESRKPMMGAEDFARYLAMVPGSFFWLGIRNPEIGAAHPWHHNSFTVDERAIKIGMAVGAKAIVDFLES